MPGKDWDDLKDIFSAALSCEAAERDAYLERACTGRPALRHAVDSLLCAHYAAARSFLQPGSIVFRAAWLFREGDQIASRFRVVRPLARGGMGEVYEVYDERLRLHVALKAIRPELLGDPDTVERFKREVLVTRDIAHEGLCRVFDFIEHALPPQPEFPKGAIVPCLSMQLLGGESLDEWLRKCRPLRPEDALPLLRQIAEALQVLHDRGVVHRDLKPSNIMLVPGRGTTRAVLTDFGLAKPISDSIFETQGAVQGGAPFYMAPELLRGDRPSAASDVYALGLIADEMVTPVRAFSAESIPSLMMQKFGEGPTRPRDRAPSLPLRWERVILRCLAPNPQDRFATAAAMLSALTECGTSAHQWPRVPLFWPARLFSRRHLAAYIGAGLLAASLVGSAVGSSSFGPSTSVLVLPFADLTGARELSYLSTGTAGELARRLSRVRGLHVYAPADPAADVAPSKRAMFTLRGYLQQEGTGLRVTAQLFSTKDGKLLWSQIFEGTKDRPLILEDRLVADAVRALSEFALATSQSRWRSTLAKASLGSIGSSGPEVPTQGTSNNAAFDAYIRGRYLFEDRTLPSALAAIEELHRATELDPSFAGAYAALADVQGVLMDLHYRPHGELIDAAERFSTHAVALDPNLPDAQLSLAAVRQMQSRWAEAEAAFRRCLELHPTSARAHRWFGGMLLQFGRFDESLALFDQALQLDPYDYPSQSAYGLALFYARQPERAARHLEWLVQQKDLLHVHLILGQVYAQLGAVHPERRQDYLEKALNESAILRQKETHGALATTAGTAEARTEYSDFIGALAWAYAGEPGAARPFLESLEIGHLHGRVSPSILGRIYAVQRRSADALEALEQSAAERDRELMYLSVSPLYDAIRDEPRFRALLQRMHLTN
jgi:serine/threonine protein kinase